MMSHYTTPSSPDSRLDAWITPGRFACVLAALVFAEFYDVLLGFGTFRYRDFGFYNYPTAAYLRHSILSAELPLWNPLSNCGIPFLAQWSHLALYPPALLYVLFPLPYALGGIAVVHLYLAGLGMFFLAREWTGRPAAAAVSAVVFAFNGLTLSCLMWSQYMATLAWTPWLLLLVERAWRRGGRWIPAASIVGGLHMLTGTPEFILFTWILAAASLVCQMLSGGPCKLLHLRRFGVITAWVFALAAPQLFPFFELLAHSHRDPSFATEDWALPLTGWANLLVPQFRCYLAKDGMVAQYSQGFTSSYYLGIGTLTLALIGLVLTPPRRALFLAGGAAICLSLALGNDGFLYPALRALWPSLGIMRYPAKFIMPALLCLTLLAGFGWRALQDLAAKRPSAAAKHLGIATAGVALGIVMLIAYSRAFPYGDANLPMTQSSGLTRLAFLLCISASLFRVLRTLDVRQARMGFLLVLALWTADLLTHYPRQSPITVHAAYASRLPRADMPTPPRIGDARAFLRHDADLFFRYLITRNPIEDYSLSRHVLFSNCNLLEDIPKVDGFFPLYLRHTHQLLEILYNPTNPPPAAILDLLSVRYQTRSDRLTRWEPRPPTPPWIAAGQIPIVVEPEQTLDVLRHPLYNPTLHTAVLAADRHLLTSQTNAVATVKLLHFSPHKVRFEIRTSAPTLATITQSFYPRWRARVDNTPAPILRANHAFQAVPIPSPGSHIVELKYVDVPLFVGLGVSLLALLAAARALRTITPVNTAAR